MTENNFLNALRSGRRLFLDGAMGTLLQAAGMPPGESPEKFCLANPDILRAIHKDYLEAGSNIITTATFGASPFKLPAGMDVEDTNRRLAEIARAAIADSGASGPHFVAGDVGPSGLFAMPLGDIAPGDLIAGFEKQIRGLVAGGVDLIFLETQFDLAEVRACAIAARRVCDLPVMASMTFEQGASLTGSSPEVFAATMQNLGISVTGTNCSLGPDEMLAVVKELLAAFPGPVMAEPNAGLPELRDGKTVFPLPPEPFAAKTAIFAELGAQILGGCCGTTPVHIKALIRECEKIPQKPREEAPRPGIVLTSRSKIVRIGPGEPLAIIGERINPTGKKKLAAQLKEGEFGEALKFADEQIAAGASVIDVNVGAPLVDEKAVLPELVSLLVSRQLAPLSLDSSNPEAIAAALPWYPASCLVNSISGENGRLEALAPLCRMYGSPAVILPLAGGELPVKASQRIAIIEDLAARLAPFGIGKSMMLVDALALAVSSMPEAAAECLKTLRWCRENGFATTLGLSNVSFGLPARDLLNATFLAMAVGAGLNSCIANPGAAAVAATVDAIAVLKGADSSGFISAYAGWSGQGGATKAAKDEKAVSASLYDAVTGGDLENALPILEKELEAGKEPFAIVNEILIPAITEVGARYERKEYFLPQLVRSAETMQKAFRRLKPLLEEAGEAEKKPVIVMATVEGDIHDIGKNIVCLLLGNHGFEVVDAGKDAPAEKIVNIAKERGATLIGLSALMTTTMARMEDTIGLVKKLGLPIKVMVGGAAVTRDFAQAIGADAYCEDAVAAVAAAKKLIAA